MSKDPKMFLVVVVVLPNSFRVMEAQRNSTETHAQVRGQEKAVTVAVKSRQFAADKTEKGQFLRGNRRNLPEERVVRKIKYISGMPYLCNDRNMGEK